MFDTILQLLPTLYLLRRTIGGLIQRFPKWPARSSAFERITCHRLQPISSAKLSSSRNSIPLIPLSFAPSSSKNHHGKLTRFAMNPPFARATSLLLDFLPPKKSPDPFPGDSCRSWDKSRTSTASLGNFSALFASRQPVWRSDAWCSPRNSPGQTEIFHVHSRSGMVEQIPITPARSLPASRITADFLPHRFASCSHRPTEPRHKNRARTGCRPLASPLQPCR